MRGQRAAMSTVNLETRTGLAGLLWPLLERVWPSDRVVLGLRVCRSLHRELLANPCRALLSKRRLASVTKEDLVHDFGRVANFQVTIKWQGGDTEVLAQALVESRIGNSLSGFVVSPGSDFGASGPQQVFDVLETCKALTRLDLRSNMLCDASVELIAQQVLLHCTSLAHLDLSYNKFGDLGALRLAEILQHCTVLAYLDVAMNAFSGAGVSFVGQALNQWPNTSLRHLDLGYNALGFTLDPNAEPPLSSLAEGLKKCTGLTYLGCCGGQIRGAGVGPLTSLLGALPEMKTVDLSINNLGAPGVELLAEAMRAGNTLTHLKLTQNRIGDQGVTALAEALGACSALTRLELGKNEIADEGVERLVAGLRGSSRLGALDLSHNEVGAQGAQALGELPPGRLTYLDLSFNSCGDAACRLPSRLSCLTHLHLGNSSVADAGAAQLATALLLCPTLSRLELPANSLSSVAAAAPSSTPSTPFTFSAFSAPAPFTSSAISRPGPAPSPFIFSASAPAPASSTCSGFAPVSMEELLAAARSAQPPESAPKAVVALGGVRLAEALGSCEGMAHVDLSQTELGGDAAKALAKAMPRMRSLRYLGLRYNSSMGKGLGAVIEGLPACPKLATLHLSWCQVGIGEAERLAGVLGECCGLEELLLDKNELGDQGATRLAAAMGRCWRLAVLDLGYNNITDAGAGALAAELAKLSALRKLVLSDNDIGDVGVQSVAAAVGQSPALAEINLSSNRRGALNWSALFPGVPRFNMRL